MHISLLKTQQMCPRCYLKTKTWPIQLITENCFVHWKTYDLTAVSIAISLVAWILPFIACAGALVECVTFYLDILAYSTWEICIHTKTIQKIYYRWLKGGIQTTYITPKKVKKKHRNRHEVIASEIRRGKRLFQFALQNVLDTATSQFIYKNIWIVSVSWNRP